MHGIDANGARRMSRAVADYLSKRKLGSTLRPVRRRVPIRIYRDAYASQVPELGAGR